MNTKVNYVACDMHKRYSVFISCDKDGQLGQYERIPHDKEQIRAYLNNLPKRVPVAVESTGNWYWLIDEIEKAGLIPRLAHARKSKLMMGHLHKTDKLDAKGLVTLLRNNTLPTVWIPPADLRDTRELLRWRTFLTHLSTQIKNRVHATFSKYGLIFTEVSDIFGKAGLQAIQKTLPEIPPESQTTVKMELDLLAQVKQQIKQLDSRLNKLLKDNIQTKIIQTAPGIGKILSHLMLLEIGDISRFNRAEQLASYSGLVSQVHSSGGKTYYGRTSSQADRYLKWGFVEAANAIVKHKAQMQNRHAVILYERIKARKGSQKAKVAVARHLSEAVFHMLTTGKDYQEPKKLNVSSTQRQARYSSAT